MLLFREEEMMRIQLPRIQNDITMITYLSSTCPLRLIRKTIQFINNMVQSIDDSCYKQ